MDDHLRKIRVGVTPNSPRDRSCQGSVRRGIDDISRGRALLSDGINLLFTGHTNALLTTLGQSSDQRVINVSGEIEELRGALESLETKLIDEITWLAENSKAL